MHKTANEAVELAEDLLDSLKTPKTKVMIAPPFTALAAVGQVLANSPVLLGAQNMASEESGAHTGEIAPRMLTDVGVKAVILGHSERRIVYGEKDPLIRKKLELALKNSFEVIICVGETIEQREAGQVEKVVGEQISSALGGLGISDLENITIAYEPVWAIGTGKTATPEDADAVHSFIRGSVSALFNSTISEDITIQYGGSVKAANVKELMAMENIDGALVGGASLDIDQFLPIVEFEQ